MTDNTENTSGLSHITDGISKEPSSVQMKSPKTTFGTIAGNVSITPGPEILARMQEYIDQRTSPMSTFVGGLKDAAATIRGTTADRDREKRAEAESIFKMRNDIAMMQQAQEQTQRAGELTDRIMGIGGSGTTTGGANTNLSGIPESVLKQMALLKAQKNPIAAQEVYQKWLSGETAEATKRKYNVEAGKQTTYFIPDANGNMQEHQLTPDQWDALPQRIKNRAINSITGEIGAPVVTPVVPQGDGLTPKDISKVESNNNPNVAPSSKGALGVMQVMPNTSKDPGFGVTPAKDDSKQELERVGIDYFNALKNNYGNDTLAAIAYNFGPGNTDKWLKETNGDFNKLPKETQDYIGKVHLANALGSRNVTQPSAGQPKTAQTVGQYKQQLEQQRELQKENIESGKEAHKQFLDNTNIQTVSNRETNSTRWEEWIKKNGPRSDKIVGLMNDPTLVNAVANVLTSGVNTTQGNVSIPGLEEAFQKMQKGVKREDVEALQEIKQILESRILDVIKKSKGSSSDKDMDAFRTIAGSSKSGIDLINKLQQYDKLSIETDKADRSLYDRVRKENKGALDFTDYNSHPERANIYKNHNERVREIARSQYVPKKAPVRPTNVPQGAKYSPSTNTWWLNGKQVG